MTVGGPFRQGGVGRGGAGPVCRAGGGGQAARGRVHTDPEWVEVVLIMPPQLPMWVTGSEHSPAGQSSLSGIA